MPQLWNNIIILSLLAPGYALGGELRLLELDHASFEVWKLGDNRDPYFPYQRPIDYSGKDEGTEEWHGGAAFNLNLTLASYQGVGLYWDNKPYLNGTKAQVRQAGWEWEVGAGVGRCQNVFWRHHSTHLLDAASDHKYPLILSKSTRLTLGRKGSKNTSL
jgi:hypothetical protein